MFNLICVRLSNFVPNSVRFKRTVRTVLGNSSHRDQPLLPARNRNAKRGLERSVDDDAKIALCFGDTDVKER